MATEESNLAAKISMNDSTFKALVADDSAVYRKLVQRTLSTELSSIFFANTGEEAVRIFDMEHPSMVITDWVMPDLTGIELCQKIRTDAHSSYTYIIMLTSIADKENVVKGLSAGADDYLTKPFDPDELLARVRVGRRLVDLQKQIEAKNRLLEELALTDALTGLSNRRAIVAWATRQLSGAARHGFPFWVVLSDLDHFKLVNDNYGHDAGDMVLKRFAEILRANTRFSDISGRIGGEEFLQIITHVDEKGVLTAVQHVCEEFAAEEFMFRGAIAPVKVTASFGIAGFCGTAAPDFSQLVSQADTALYRAKHLGRNRIEMDIPASAPVRA
jgi:two-component system, cell cycle response regulator